jgi:hypothetical protein
MGERSTLNAQLSTPNSESLFQRLPSAPQIEATLHVVNFVAIGFKYGTIAKFGWPDIGIAGVNDVPTNASFTDTALEVWNVCRLLQALQFPQLLLVRRVSEGFAYQLPHFESGCERTSFT